MTENVVAASPNSVTTGMQAVLAALRRTEPLCRWASSAGMALFLLLVCLTFLDVLLRYFFNRPLDGTIELTELVMVVVFFSSVAYTQWQKGHVTMDIITARLSAKNRAHLEAVTGFWSVAIVFFCIVAMVQYSSRVFNLSPVWHIPYRPFVLFASAGCSLLLVALVHDLLEKLLAVIEGGRAGSLALVLAAAILPTLAGWWFASHRLAGVSSVQLGLWGLVVMFGLFFLGMPVAYSMLGAAFLFIANMRGMGAALDLMGKCWYASIANYTWSPLMFFLLMGFLCFHGRFGEDLYRAARSWMGHLRGGLATASVCACTAFGAVVGDSLAGSVAMATIALPEMRRSNYDDGLSVGTLACSGTLGSLIPPSTTMILYGVLAEQSVGQLFIAGVIPGLICMLCFIAVIWAMVLWKPRLAPPLPKADGAERLTSLSAALPILVIFFVVIGGIYGGVFTATEGGGIGAFATLALALALRRLPRDKLKKTLNESAKFISMCFILLGSADLLSYFMTMSRIPMVLANSVAALQLPSLGVLLVIILVSSFLGCFIPAIPLVLICVPIYLPIAKTLGWNLIWFGVIVTLIKNMACITPPFGINLFVMQGMAKIPLSTMYKASMPFILALFVCLALIIAFPQLSLFLPGMMH